MYLRLASDVRDYFTLWFARRFRLHLTVEGWTLVTLMLLIGLAALNTSAPLLYLMFSMLCSFFVLSAVLATNTIRSLAVRRACPRAWTARTPMKVELRLRNRKKLTASYSLRVQDFAADRSLAGAAFFDRVDPGGREQAQEYECWFPQRGLFRFNTIEIATRFPFGLIERRLQYDQPQELLVLPQTIAVDHRMREARADLGDFDARRKGNGSSLYGLREYNTSFSARDIHWKVSAKRGELMVKEYESEERRRACVILDNRIDVSSPAAAKAFEEAIVVAASVVDWFCRGDHEVELRTASGLVGFGTGPAHSLRCRRALARIEPLPPGTESRFLAHGDPSVVTVPVCIGRRAPARPGTHPAALEDFRAELDESFRSRRPSESELAAP